MKSLQETPRDGGATLPDCPCDVRSPPGTRCGRGGKHGEPARRWTRWTAIGSTRTIRCASIWGCADADAAGHGVCQGCGSALIDDLDDRVERECFAC